MSTHAPRSRRRNTSLQTILRFERHNPFRSPDWRWQRAGEFVEGRRRLPGDGSDPAFGNAVRLRRDWERCETLRKIHAFERQEPAFIAAWSLYQRGGQEVDRLQAWLLTRAPLDRVAAKCDLGVDVVVTYEQLFFDVRDYFRHTDWVVGRAIMGNDSRSGELSLGTAWRLIGFFAGPRILQAAMVAAPNEAAVWEFESLDLHSKEGREVARARLAIAALMTNSIKLFPELMRISAVVRQIEAMEAAKDRLNKPLTTAEQVSPAVSADHDEQADTDNVDLIDKVGEESAVTAA